MTGTSNPDLDRAEALIHQADEAFTRAYYAEAETQYQAALALIELLHASFPEQSEILIACCRLGQGRLLSIQTRFEESQALLLPLIPLLIMDPARLALVYMTLGENAHTLGHRAEAKQQVYYAYTLRVEWLGPTHPDTLDSLSTLALIHHWLGEKDQARSLVGKAVGAAEKYRGEPAAQIGRVFLHQGIILMHDPGRMEQARAALKQALAIFEASEGADHPDFGQGLHQMARLLARESRWSEALPLLLRALANFERVFGPWSLLTSFVLGDLSEAEQHLDHPQAAYQYAAWTLIAAVRSRGARNTYTRSVLRRIVDLLEAKSQSGEGSAQDMLQPLRACLLALDEAVGKPEPQDAANQAAAQLGALAGRLEAQVSRSPRANE